jgi:hypothetical protein
LGMRQWEMVCTTSLISMLHISGCIPEYMQTDCNSTVGAYYSLARSSSDTSHSRTDLSDACMAPLAAVVNVSRFAIICSTNMSCLSVVMRQMSNQFGQSLLMCPGWPHW